MLLRSRLFKAVVGVAGCVTAFACSTGIASAENWSGNIPWPAGSHPNSIYKAEHLSAGGYKLTVQTTGNLVLTNSAGTLSSISLKQMLHTT